MDQYISKPFKQYSRHAKLTRFAKTDVKDRPPSKTKRKMISGFTKAVIICDSSDLTTSDTTTYRPNNIVVELLKKDPLRYGKVTFYKFTSEKEEREQLCQQFTILRNKRFWFASADQYGKLNFHHWDEWTGRNIRRWLPGSSAMYIILEGDGRKIPTLSNLLKQDSLTYLKKTQSAPILCHTNTNDCTATSTAAMISRTCQELPVPSAAGTSQHSAGFAKTSSSSSLSTMTSSNSTTQFTGQSKYNIPVSLSSETDDNDESLVASNEPSEDSRESVAVLHDTHDKNTGGSMMLHDTHDKNTGGSMMQKTFCHDATSIYSFSEYSVVASVENDLPKIEDGAKSVAYASRREYKARGATSPRDIRSRGEESLKRIRIDDDSTTYSRNEKGASLSSILELQNGNDLSTRQSGSPKRQKLATSTEEDCFAVCKKPVDRSTPPHEHRLTVIASSAERQVPARNATPIPFVNPFLFHKSTGASASQQIKHIMEIQEKMLSSLANKDAKDLFNFTPNFNAFIVPGGLLPMERAVDKKDEQNGTPSTGKVPNMAFLPFGFPPTPYALGAVSTNGMPVLTRMTNNTSTLVPSPKGLCCTTDKKKAKQVHRETETKCEHTSVQTCSDEQEIGTRNTEAAPASNIIKTDSKKQFSSLVDVFLEEETLTSTPHTRAGLNGLVEDMIPRSGFCEGGEVFTMFLRHPIQDGHCRSNLVARFGKGSSPIPLQLINPFTLRGTVPKSHNPVRTAVLLESAQGQSLGSVTYLYKDKFISSLRRVMSSSRYGRQIINSMITAEDSCTEELLELLVYMAAQANSIDTMEMVFNSPKGEEVYSCCKNRSRQPEDLACAAGHMEAVTYLKKMQSRFIPNLITPKLSDEDRETPREKTEDLDEETDNLMMLSSIASSMVTTSPAMQSVTSPSPRTTEQKASHRPKTSCTHIHTPHHPSHCNGLKTCNTQKNGKHNGSNSHSGGFLKKVFVLPWNSRYLPSQSELCKLRATQRTYGKVQFNADMTEEEVTSRIRNSFEEIQTSSIRLAVVDQTGKLVFYDGKWTGRIIRKKLRGNSVLYVVPGPKDATNR